MTTPASFRPHVLIVDDERDIREMLAAYLTRQGCHVLCAADTAEARHILNSQPVSLVLLDVMLPGESGLSLASFIHASSGIPVILVTAKAEEADRINGLNAGSDDYVVKPFSPGELYARMCAVLRRSGGHRPLPSRENQTYAFAGWTLRTGRRELIDAQGVVTPLPKSEFNLLHALVTHPHQMLSREQLVKLSEGPDAVLFDRSIDNKIRRLRSKLEAVPASPELIKTVWGGGYVFAAEVSVR
ncbi:response regulator [Novosphingobium terrae]|uniref:response regulator n=1 Tax=Novosphingobium terrae TaxID=2726189 RepID=UPI00197E75E1|nr:response regulator transcription factor [Novosphingobium terrae]